MNEKRKKILDGKYPIRSSKNYYDYKVICLTTAYENLNKIEIELRYKVVFLDVFENEIKTLHYSCNFKHFFDSRKFMVWLASVYNCKVKNCYTKKEFDW